MKQDLYGIGFEIHKTLHTTDVVFPGKPYLGATAWPTIPDGVYKSWRRNGKETFWVCKLYSPVNHKTPAQVIRQNIYHDAVTIWNSLTKEEKQVYRKLAQSKYMSGYNIFMKRYLKSH